MQIAILGAGQVGATLGHRLAELGHTVRYGVRHPGEARYTGMPVSLPAEAAAGAEVVILATPWQGVEDALGQAGGAAGAILLDATNPLSADLTLTHGLTDSGGEQVARWAPGARVVKIFNTVGFEVMAQPVYGDHHAVMFYAGDDEGAKAVAAELAASLGFEPRDAGPLRHARYLEPYAMVWIDQAVFRGRGRTFGLVVHDRAGAPAPPPVIGT